MSKPIKNRLYGNERKYVEEVLATEFSASQGSIMTQRLEAEFADKFGGTYAIAHINGTATMHALLEAKGIGPGDEVIVTPLTMSATTFAVLQANATPVFADVDPDTFQISYESIKSCITDKTKAIITVALFGLSPEMDPIMELANQYDIFVIEDNAECFLGKYKGKMVGTLGHASSFSFQSTKHLTSGEGGMVLTDDLELALRVRRVQSLGYAGVSATKGKITKSDIQDPNYARHVSMGWNYRMPELCSAVALAQMENIDSLVDARVKAAKIFNDVVTDCDWLVVQKTPENCVNTFWTYVVKIDDPRITWHQFRDAFVENGGDGIYAAWMLTYLEPMFQNMALLGREHNIPESNKSMYKKGLCPVAENLQPRLLCFKTNYWDISEALIQADVLRKTIKQLGESLI